MPIVVDSPLGAAANAAASFLQGRQEAEIRNRTAALAQQKQNSEDALQAAQAQMYLGHGQQFVSKADQQTAETPAFIARMTAQGYKLNAEGNWDNAKGSVLVPAQAALMAAQGNNQNAQATNNTALAGLHDAQKQVQLQGELPFLKSKTTYTNSLPGYNAAKITALENGIGERGFAAAQATAGRIQVAGLDNQSRIVLGSMVNDRIANGQSETDAMKGALDQYNEGLKAYASANAANNALVRAGQQPGPTPIAPVFKDPRQSQSGVNVNVTLPSQSISQGPNGQPIYTRQPASTINVQGEVGALRNALATKDNAAVQQRFNSRSDLTPQQKALIWTSANQAPAQPPSSPGGFQVPLGNPTAPPSVSGGAFGVPQTPFKIPGT